MLWLYLKIKYIYVNVKNFGIMINKYFGIFVIYVLSVGCDSLIDSDDAYYALVDDQKISMISLTYETNVTEYRYEYNSEGILKSIITDGSSYEYSYSSSGYSINKGGWFKYQFDDIEHPSECLIYYLKESSNEEPSKFKYSYNGSMLSSLETPDCVCSYKWDNKGNLIEVSSRFDFGGPMKVEYTYSDVINNFNVPIPGLCLLFPSYMFSDFCYGYMPSTYLPACTYSRNVKGNINKIIFDDLGFQLEIHYAD